MIPHSNSYNIIHIGKAEAALADLIALFPVLVVFLVAQRMIVRGQATVGSVKGQGRAGFHTRRAACVKQ